MGCHAYNTIAAVQGVRKQVHTVELSTQTKGYSTNWSRRVGLPPADSLVGDTGGDSQPASYVQHHVVTLATPKGKLVSPLLRSPHVWIEIDDAIEIS